MKIYRIYKMVADFEWSPYSNEYTQVDRDETIKYVDSKDKVYAFLDNIDEQNKPGEKCSHCPLINLTKRQYMNGKHDMLINQFECHAKDIYFDGNEVFCKNTSTMDLIDYQYEEIEVE